MATTTNYAWTTPDNSGLVKNGAQDIRTLGSAVDTSLWNVGFGQAGKNKIINGNFDIWQRGTSQTANGYGSADRFSALSDGSYTNSRQTFTAGTAPVAGYEGQYFYRSARTTGTYMIVQQNIENVQTFAGQTVTLSYWAKCSSGTITNEPLAFQNFGSGGSANVDIATTPSSATVTTTWTRFSHTLTIPSIAGKTIGTGSYLAFRPLRHVSGTGATIDIWGIQVEVGSVATPFQTASGTIQGELALCQRYYYRTNITGFAPATMWGMATGTTTVNAGVCFPSTMRTTPTSIDYALLRATDTVGVASNISTLTLGGSTTLMGFVDASGLSGFTQYRPAIIQAQSSGNAFLGFSAEL